VKNFDWLPFTPLWSPSPVFHTISTTVMITTLGTHHHKP
jgi:hypothetical protein